MDDFSWGATRVVQGDKGGNHGDVEGKFDPSNIVMKRWAEFERERRLRSGTHSRDSTYDIVQRTGSPDRAGSTRYSMVSSDTYHSNPSQQDSVMHRPTTGLLASATAQIQDAEVKTTARQRLDNVPLLELPAPLGPDAAARRTGAAPAAAGSIAVVRPREPSPAGTSSGSHSMSTNSSRPAVGYLPNPEFSADEEKRPMIASAASSPDPERNFVPFQPLPSTEVRHGLVSSGQAYPGVQEASYAQGMSAEPEEDTSGPWNAMPANAVGSTNSRPREQPPHKGFSLVDDGPVASSEGMRPVQRGARRMSNNQGPNTAGPRARNSQQPGR